MTLLLLSGCTEEQKVEKVLEKESTVYEVNNDPRDVRIVIGDSMFKANIDRFCWNEDLTECEKMEPSHPKDTNNEQSSFIGRVKYGEHVQINYDVSDYSNLPKGDHFELLLYQNEELVPIEVKNNAFIVPEIQGMQYYVYKVTVDNAYKGIAYYSFALNAQQN